MKDSKVVPNFKTQLLEGTMQLFTSISTFLIKYHIMNHITIKNIKIGNTFRLQFIQGATVKTLLCKNTGLICTTWVR